MKKVIGLTLTFSALAIHCCEAMPKSQFKGREWEYMEEVFMHDVDSRVETDTKKIRYFMNTLGTALGGGIMWHMLDKQYMMLDSLLTFTYALLGFTCGMVMGLVYQDLYYQTARKKEFDLFIKDWPENKLYTPECFHEMLEETFQAYLKDQKSSEYKKLAGYCIYHIFHAIRAHFPERYRRPNVIVSQGFIFV